MSTTPLFLETLKIYRGKFYNLPLHLSRMAHSLQHFYGSVALPAIRDEDIPESYREGLVKCRIIYSDTHFEIQYEPYTFRTIHSLKVIESGSLVYDHKFYDRTSLHHLCTQKESADDILILKNGQFTDTSFSNVVFQDKSGKLYTPSSYLLAGTKRKKLLQENKIQEKEILISEVFNYEKIYLINAMIDLEDAIYISPQNLI